MADDVEFMVYDGGWWDAYDRGNHYKVVSQTDKGQGYIYPKDNNPENWINKTNRVYINQETPPAKEVKIEPISTTSGFKYLNDSGLEEKVLLEYSEGDILLNVYDSIGGKAAIYLKDTPKLIAALKASYLYETGEVI